jgi:hypothetical protein
VGQGKRLQNKVASGNEEVGQTNTRTEGKLSGASAEDDIRKSSRATFILLTDRKT